MVFDFAIVLLAALGETDGVEVGLDAGVGDRKSTRLNSSHT